MSQVDLFAEPELPDWLLAEPELPDWLLAEPDPPPGDFGLRDYQLAAKSEVTRHWHDEGVRSVLCVMATGTGKTRLGAALVAGFDGRVLWLAHRDELLQQAMGALETLTGEPVGLEQARFRSGRERIVVGSIQSVHRRLEKVGDFDLVVVDEAHHALSPTYQKTLDAFHVAKVLGLTATPDRGDERALGMVFDEVAYEYDIWDAVSDGWLVPLEGRRITVEQIDISDIKTSAGDLQVGQLDQAIRKATVAICEKTMEAFADHCGPAFFPGKASAVFAAEIFNRIRPGCAASITEDTHHEERREIIRSCLRGELQWLCNCLVATEGFDWPGATAVLLGRPTKSRALYTQMVGRGTRALPGVVDGLAGPDERKAAIAQSGKPHVIIVDFVGNSGSHTLMSPEDALGGKYTEAEVKKAKELAEEGGTDPRENLSRAREILRAIAARSQATITARIDRFDPFALFGVDRGDPGDMGIRYGAKPASEKQIDALRRFKIPEEKLDGLTKGEASKLLTTCMMRARYELATFKQLSALAKYGITKTNVSFKAASEALTYLASTGWGKKQSIDPERLNAIVG